MIEGDIIDVVDPFLVSQGGNHFVKQFFVIIAESIELAEHLKQDALVVFNLLSPVLQDHRLEGLVDDIDDVLLLMVLTFLKGLDDLDNIAAVQVKSIVAHILFKVSECVWAADVELIVANDCAHREASNHVLLAAHAKLHNIALRAKPDVTVKVVEGLRVDDSLPTHVVNNVATLVKRHITSLHGHVGVVARVGRNEACVEWLDAAIQMNHLVVEVERILPNVAEILLFSVPPTLLIEVLICKVCWLVEHPRLFVPHRVRKEPLLRLKECSRFHNKF